MPPSAPRASQQAGKWARHDASRLQEGVEICSQEAAGSVRRKSQSSPHFSLDLGRRSQISRWDCDAPLALDSNKIRSRHPCCKRKGATRKANRKQHGESSRRPGGGGLPPSGGNRFRFTRNRSSPAIARSYVARSDYDTTTLMQHPASSFRGTHTERVAAARCVRPDCQRFVSHRESRAGSVACSRRARS